VYSGRLLFLLVVRCGSVVVGSAIGGGVLDVSMKVSVGAVVDSSADGGTSVGADNGVVSVTSVGAGANVVTGSVEADEVDCCSMLVKTRSCNRTLKSGRSLYFLWSLM
jgi:hypothetical protein